MIKNIRNIVIVTLFCISIIFPLVFADKQGGKVSLQENRYLAKFPSIRLANGSFDYSSIKKLGNWITDNAGGRDISFQIRDLLEYSSFHNFPLTDIVEGKQKWLYLVPSYGIADCTNSNKPTQSQIEYLQENFTRITSELISQDVQYTVMIWPNKCTIYPEYFPNTLTQVNDEPAIMTLDNELSGKPKFDFATAYDTLISHKAERQDYYKAFDYSHWNQYGAFLGYTALMEQAKRHLPNLKILTEADFNILPTIKKTNFTWGFQTEEEDLIYTLKSGPHASSDLSFFNTFGFSSKDPWKSYNYYKNTDTTLPKAIVIGDSYVWEFLLPNLAESFSELVFLHYSDMDYLDSLLNLIEPNIVMMAGLGPVSSYEFAKYSYGDSQQLNATIINNDTPTEAAKGVPYQIKIEVRNIGTQVWADADRICLSILINGKDEGYRSCLPPNSEIRPRENIIFTLSGVQFYDPSGYFFEYQLVQGEGHYFGEKQRVNITVK